MIAAAREADLGSIVAPMAVGAAAVGGLLWWHHRQRDRPANDNALRGLRDNDLPMVAPAAPLGAPPPPMPPGHWVYPVPRWQGRNPEVSDGWGSRRVGGNRGGLHRGVDIMFPRRFRGELTDVFPPRTLTRNSPHTPNYFMPPGTLVVAASDGEVWSAGWTPRGYSIVLSHGAPWATYYTHLESLRIGETRRGASRERVRAGQPLGVVGADPQDRGGVAHLHFEMWFGGNSNAAIDPTPYLRRMSIIDSPEVSPEVN